MDLPASHLGQPQERGYVGDHVQHTSSTHHPASHHSKHGRVQNTLNLRQIDLRPHDRPLAASLGNRQAKRLCRQFHNLYSRTHTLLGEICEVTEFDRWQFLSFDRLLAFEVAAEASHARAEVAVRLADCLPVTLAGVRSRRVASDNLDVAEETLWVLGHVRERLLAA